MWRVNLAWGRYGVQQAAARGDVIVIVDTLSFSSSVATAIEHGGEVYPCSAEDDAAAIAQQSGAELAVHRRDWPERGRFSLSPLSFVGMEAGTRVVLPSPNGATLCRLAAGAREVIVGCPLNARVVGYYLWEKHGESSITIVAAGERYWQPTPDGTLRFALEDYLGAGAVLSHMIAIRKPTEYSPDVLAAVAAFEGCREQLAELLSLSESGQELVEQGYGRDVRHSAQYDRYLSVPLLGEDGWIREGIRYEPDFLLEQTERIHRAPSSVPPLTASAGRTAQLRLTTVSLKK